MDCYENLIATGRVVCPKPRRAGASNFGNSVLPLRCHLRNGAEAFDSRAGAELLDLTLCKEGFQGEGFTTVSSSPPFFFGSPPCRAQNPLAQDAHFRVQKHSPSASSPSDSASLPPSHSRVKFGHKQAAVRVEGFDCQSRVTTSAWHSIL
ncbi:uncharacterized protein LOC125215339 isoform X2 [Salvia hispanica]|uniref:uncharacterized protein LOC125215339 isoform X2 n=1 Tax=Salvia hispanica TaxID=49212 RepID=UPI00200929CA|nr:uncharacterized protein LOC125215339 isoform X2 [Salvia hispanica]